MAMKKRATKETVEQFADFDPTPVTIGVESIAQQIDSLRSKREKLLIEVERLDIELLTIKRALEG